MISAAQLQVLRVVELRGEMDCASIADAARMPRKSAGNYVRALLKKGYLVERFEEQEGKGPKFKRLLARSALDLPVEIENMIDKGWWPQADVEAQQAMHRMVSIGQVIV